MIILLSLFSLLYCFLTLWLWHHWQKIEEFKPDSHPKSNKKVSVIIPIRNEAKHIISLLEDIEKQHWPDGSLFSPQQLEVIVVDDQSEDESQSLVKNFKGKNFILSIIPLNLPSYNVASHKKLALSRAIEIAKGDIIITTDGDCRVGRMWVAMILGFMNAQDAVMVSAPVTFEQGETRFEKLQLIEFASLIGTGGACLQAGKPNMCNGANLAFTKKAFQEVNGYEGSMHIPSGDDEFLMQKLHQHYPNRIFFLKSREAVVTTKAQQSLKQFYHQRKRWAGKWKLHKNFVTALLALFIFSFHLLLIIGGVLTLIGAFSWQVMLLLLLLKAVVEVLFLSSVLRDLNKRLSLSNFLLLQLIYSPYAVFFGIVANFGGYQWKERKYS